MMKATLLTLTLLPLLPLLSITVLLRLTFRLKTHLSILAWPGSTFTLKINNLSLFPTLYFGIYLLLPSESPYSLLSLTYNKTLLFIKMGTPLTYGFSPRPTIFVLSLLSGLYFLLKHTSGIYLHLYSIYHSAS